MSPPDPRPGAPRLTFALGPLSTAAMLVVLALTGGAAHADGDDPGRPTAEALILKEQTRAAVAEAFDLFRRPAGDGANYVAKALIASDRMVEIGPGAVPYLANEMEQTVPDTFYFCAFTLGRIAGEPSARALHDAIERAAVESGDFAIYRTAWAAHALAMAGDADALDLLNRGTHLAADVMMHRETSAIEAAAMQIPRQKSVPILLAQLERYRGDDRMIGQRTWVLRALRRLGDPSAVPAIVALLDDPGQLGLRSEAARALGGLPSPATTEALVRAIADEDFRVRRTVALSLETLAPAAAVPAILEQLETEEDTVVRGFFYQVLATTGDPDDTSWVDRYLGRPDPSDRRLLLGAVASLGAARADLLRSGLDDHLGVMVDAADALTRIGDEASDRALAAAVRSAAPDRLGPLSRIVIPRGGTATLAAAVERVLSPELREAARDPSIRQAVCWMLEALRARGVLGLSSSLGEWRKRSTDPYLQKQLDALIPQFAEFDRHGKATGPWLKAVRGDDVEQRRNGAARLGTASSAKAARAVAAAFEREDLALDEQIELVETLVRIGRTAAAAPVLERILLDDAYGDHTLRTLRDAAAWAARRLGGPAMIELLASAVEHRGAREVEPLIYLTLMDAARGTELIERYRVTRMRSFARRLGDEQRALERLTYEIERGTSPQRWDRRPDALPIR